MATLKLRDSGWWQAVIRRKGYPKQSRTFEKRADAEKWARGIENAMDRGIFVSRAEAESTTLIEALTRYKKEITPRKRGAAVEEYRINALLAHTLSKRTLAGIRGAEIAMYRDERLGGGMAASSVMKELALLSHLFETANKEWAIEVENPVKKISKPKIDNARERRLVGDEENYLLKALDDPGESAGDRRNVYTPVIVRFAIETAARQSEIISMTWKDVDLDRCVARLRGIGGLATKNDDKFRDVPLSSAAVALIRGDGKVTRLRKGKVFATTASALKQSFSRAVARGRRLYQADCKTAGIDPMEGFLEDLTFHDLRHEATSRLAEKLQMHELMKVTGHKDSRMLARYYHPRAEDLAKKLG